MREGAILGLVVIFMLLFTLLGYGLLHLASVDSIEVVKSVQSTQAFWIAEAGIERAIFNLPGTEDFDGPLGDGNYDVTVEQSYDPDTGYTYTNMWDIDSQGTVGEQSRRIMVTVGPVYGAITSTGAVDREHGDLEIDGEVQEFATFTFEEIFGLTKDEVKSMAVAPDGYTYYNPPNNVAPVEGITYVSLSASDQLLLTDSNWEGSGLLFVEGDLKITGGEFNGIIWVTGTLNMSTGNVTVKGAIFVECEDPDDTLEVHGTPLIEYNTEEIDKVFSDIGTTNYGRRILSWQEIVEEG